MSDSHGRFAGTTRETATVHIPDESLSKMDDLAAPIDHNRSAEFRAAAEAWIAVGAIVGDSGAELDREARIELIERAVRGEVDG